MTDLADLIEQARADRAAEVEALKSPSRLRPLKRRRHEAAVAALSRLDEVEDELTDGIACDHDEPRLTVEEWDFIREVTR